MPKQVLFGQQVTEGLSKGADKLANAVGTSLSPKGRNVGIDMGYEAQIIHDGVKIARQIDLEDPAENFAVKVLRQAANKQVQTVGDGTTVSIILAHAIYKECLKNIAAGTNAMSLRKGLEEGKELLLKELDQLSIPVKTKEQAVEVASISCADEVLGKQIGEMIFDIGKEGVATVEESNTNETYIDRQEGMQFEHGYISPYFITDPNKMEATIENAYILITDKTVNNVNEIKDIMEAVIKSGQPNMVIIGQDVFDSALGSCIATKIRGGMNLLCIKAPYAGKAQSDFLDDLALLTGGHVISQAEGRRFETVKLEELGRAERITSTQDATLVVGGKGDKTDIKERVNSLRLQQERNEGSDYQKEKLRERIAKLTNGIAVVYVGAPTEIQRGDLKERADDAVKATLAALKDGIVPGGETVYLTIRSHMGDTVENGKLLYPDRAIANRIIYDSLEKPFYKLLENAGMKPDAYINVLKPGQGVDVIKEEVVDLVKSGIIDPTLVAKEAITNAISTAIALMTTEVLVLPIPEEKK